jgi:hypothetical protein
MCQRYCEDCGTGKTNGICTNCNEELYINDYQMPEFIGTEYEVPTSEEWNKKVNEQRKRINNN